MKTSYLLVSLTLACTLASCSKPKADDAATTSSAATSTAQAQTQSAATATTATPQVSSDPLVEAAQKIINSNYSYNGYACTTLSLVSPALDNHGFVTTPMFSKLDEATDLAARQWAFIAKQGAASVKKFKAQRSSGPTEVTAYFPNLKLKEADGKGFFHSSAADRHDTALQDNTHYCYGKWTVTKVLDSNVQVASDNPNMKKIAVQVELTGAPAWAKTKDADILNQHNDVYSSFPTYDDMNQAAVASLSTPARVLLDVPK